MNDELEYLVYIEKILQENDEMETKFNNLESKVSEMDNLMKRTTKRFFICLLVLCVIIISMFIYILLI